MTDERGTVIRDIIGNSNESVDDGNDRENEERKVGGEDTLATTLTPTHSLLLILNTILTSI